MSAPGRARVNKSVARIMAAKLFVSRLIRAITTGLRTARIGPASFATSAGSCFLCHTRADDQKDGIQPNAADRSTFMRESGGEKFLKVYRQTDG